MVALQTSVDIPSTINTVEKLHLWSATVLNNLHPSTTVVEVSGAAQLAITAAPFWITASEPQTWRYITRASIALDRNWQRGSGKIWTFAQELSVAAIPNEFKS